MIYARALRRWKEDIMPQIGILILVTPGMFAVLGEFSMLAHIYNLNNIKNKTVGNGQHGTARWARKKKQDKFKKITS